MSTKSHDIQTRHLNIMENEDRMNKTEFDCHIHSWEIIKALFRQSNGHYLVKHQIDSYDDFVQHKIPNIIGQFNPVTICHEYKPETNNFKYKIHVNFGKIYLGYPKIFENNGSSSPMFPNDARKRNLSYSSSLYIDVSFTMRMYDSEHETTKQLYHKKFKKLIIGKIPVMLRSRFCILNNRDIMATKMVEKMINMNTFSSFVARSVFHGGG